MLPANACRALAQAGVLEQVRDRASAPREWITHPSRADSRGPLARWKLDPAIQERYGVPFLVIHRYDLRCILYEAVLASKVAIHLGTRVDFSRTDFRRGLLYAAVRTTERSSEVLEDGEGESVRVLEADLVVAANGQASTARTLVGSHPTAPKTTGKIVHRVLMDKKRMEELGMADLVNPPCIHVWFGPQQMGVGYLLRDVFNVALTVEERDGLGEENDVVVGPRPSTATELQAVYGADWDPRIQTIVREGRGFLKWQLLDYDVDSVNSWVRDRDGEKPTLTLTGDAAHAMGPYM